MPHLLFYPPVHMTRMGAVVKCHFPVPMGAMALVFKFYVSKSASNSVYAVHLASSWFISNVTILKMCPLNFIWSLLSGMALTTTLPPSRIQS